MYFVFTYLNYDIICLEFQCHLHNHNAIKKQFKQKKNKIVILPVLQKMTSLTDAIYVLVYELTKRE